MSSQYVDLPLSGSSGGVTSLNSLTGALTIVAGSGITVTPSGSNITIAATGGGSGTVTSVSVVSANGFAGTVATATSTPAITISTSVTGLISGNGTAISAAALTSGNIYVGSASNLPASVTMSGDATIVASGALTLATVNTNTGSFGSSTSIPSFTVNGKGLITAASGNAVIAPAGTLSGTVLNSTVVTSSLTAVGTISTGVWNGTAITVANGGTGVTSAAAYTVVCAGTTSTGAFQEVSGTGTTGQVLTSNGAGALPTWQAAASGGVTSVAMTVPTFLSVSGSPITSSGTLGVTLSGTALPVANGGTGATSLGTSPQLLFNSSGAVASVPNSSASDASGYIFPDEVVFSLPGPRVVQNDNTNWFIFPWAGKFSKAWVVAKTGPTGASFIIDLQLSTNNGSTFATLWGTNPGNKPTIAAAAVAGNTTSFDTTTFAAGNCLRIDIDQVGSTIAGSDLTLVLACFRQNT